MVNKYEIKIEAAKKNLITDTVSDLDQRTINNYIELFDFDKALERIWSTIKFCNKLIDDEKPWILAKTDTETLGQKLQILSEYLFRIAVALEPFMPETSGKMKKQLKTLKPEPLFPRIESRTF